MKSGNGGWWRGLAVWEDGGVRAGLCMVKGDHCPPPQIWSQSDALTCLGGDSLGSEKQWVEKERIWIMGVAYGGKERAFAMPGGCF